MSLLSTLKSLFGLGPKAFNAAKGDRKLSCMDCRNEFVFDAGEQVFFKEKGFTDPKRCPSCRKKVRFRMRRRGGRGGGGENGGGGRGRRHHGRRNFHGADGESPYQDER